MWTTKRKLTTDALKQIRNDGSFKAFFETVLKKKELLDDVSDPEVPRKRRVPARFEDGQAEPSFPETSEDLYHRVYFEALDSIIAAITERFDQPSFQVYMKLESLLLGAVSSQDISSGIKHVSEIIQKM